MPEAQRFVSEARLSATQLSMSIKSQSTLTLITLLFYSLARAQSAPVSLRLAGDEWFLKALTQTDATAAFERQTGIHVAVIFKNDRTIMADLDRSPQAGQAAYDIIVVRHRLLGALVEKGEVRPIDVFLSDPALHDPTFNPDQQLFANWWKGLSAYGDHIYGYPYAGLTAYLCYRKDLVEDPVNRRNFRIRFHRELRRPYSWQEYLELAQFFNHPAEHFYGTYIQGSRSLALWYEWLNFIYSFHGNILDGRRPWEYGDIVVNSPQNVAATEQYLKAIAFSPPDTLNYGWNEAQNALQQGHVFMGLLWSDQVPFLENPELSKVAGKIGYAVIPSNAGAPVSQMEGLTYLLVSNSSHTREAYRFLEFAMSPQFQREQTIRGSSSIRKSTYDQPAVKNLPYTPIFLSSVPEAVPKSTVPESDQMTKAAENRLSEMVKGESSPRDGLNALALDLQRILGSKSRLRYPIPLHD